jgi:NifU-like protein involved in Fe-S cluster formation
MIDALYSDRILGLAANMPRAGRLARPEASAERTSKLCGSKIVVDVAMDGDRVADFAQDVKACALGQASAAILGQYVVGASLDELELAKGALSAMLKADGPPPVGRFADLAVLQPVKDYPARHASTLLAFEAVVAAAREARANNTTRTMSAGAHSGRVDAGLPLGLRAT